MEMETVSTLPWKHCIFALCCVIPYPVQSWMLDVVQRPWSLDGKVLVQLSRESRCNSEDHLELKASLIWLTIRCTTLNCYYNCCDEKGQKNKRPKNATVTWHYVNCQKCFHLATDNRVSILSKVIKLKRQHTRKCRETQLMFPPINSK